MKKVFILLFLSSMMLTSCWTPFTYTSNTSYLDYSFFKDKDFFITEANTVSFPYESLGSISVFMRSGFSIKKAPKKGGALYNYDKNILYDKTGEFKDVTQEDIYYLVYNTAKEKGANGILRFKIEYVEPTQYGKGRSNYGYKITGMAIKK